MAIICDTGIGIGIETAFHITHAPREPRAANHYMHNILESVFLHMCLSACLCVCVGGCIWVSLTYAALAAAFIMCKYIWYIFNVVLQCHIKNAMPQRFDHYKGILFYLFSGQHCGRATKRIQLADIKCNVQMKMQLSKGKTDFIIQLNVSIRMKLLK